MFVTDLSMSSQAWVGIESEREMVQKYNIEKIVSKGVWGSGGGGGTL